MNARDSRGRPSLTSAMSNDYQKQRLKNIGLFMADQLLAGFIVGPLTVFFWWGAWNILGRHLYPDDLNISSIICMVIGNCGLVFLALTQEFWKKMLPVEESWLAWLIGYHGYIAICGLFNVCHWRGMWIFLDHYTGTGVYNFWITYVIGQSFLLFFKSSKTLGAPPMVIISDTTSSSFTYLPRFRTKPAISLTFLYDVLLTVVIIHQLVVFYWRGLWGLLDELFLKDNQQWSTWVGFAVGYLLMLLLCLVQPLFNHLFIRIPSLKTYRKLKSSKYLKPSIGESFKLRRSYNCQQSRIGDTRLPSSHTPDDLNGLNQKIVKDREVVLRWLLEVIVYFFANIVNVFIWRSVWRFCDEYILPWNKDAGNAAGICIGYGVLVILRCGPSLTLKGCHMEGEETLPQEFVGFVPNFYFRRLYSEAVKK